MSQHTMNSSKLGAGLRTIAGCGLIVAALAAVAQNARLTSDALPAPAGDVTTNARFFAAHGRKSLISGYTGRGLEVWAYPFEILDNYRVSFRPQGTASFLSGEGLLSRVEYGPTTITRVYLGPEFVVEETLFAPLNDSGAVIRYQVRSRRPVEIAVNARPVLNLMWPAALGGQSVGWDAQENAFEMREPAKGWRALVGSPDLVAHDVPVNRAQGGVSERGLNLILGTNEKGSAALYIALEPPRASASVYQRLVHESARMQEEADAERKKFSGRVLGIRTPDARVNEALAAAETALDQSWVCSDQLGCGLIAGYGPSRDARRPQYDWYFAGDGLIGANALIDIGDLDTARKELEFILRYQDAKTGMIWHEISQSAPFVDWAHDYPYMYVHVDITFQFLEGVAHYVAVSGDANFVRAHWEALASAYRYCRSLVDAGDGLPRIPADKEGGNEQARLVDELSLSSSWLAAASGFAHIAEIAGHPELTADAQAAAQRARTSIPERYWDAKAAFLIAGHTAAGTPMQEQRSAAADAAVLNLLPEHDRDAVLDRLAGSAFQADWGTRGISEDSPNYKPESYAEGSVFALSTTGAASAFWDEHRPVSAYQIWSSLAPWNSLDSIGHLHEALAGDVYRPGAESVPEQMWSSAGFLDAAIRGLFGLNVDEAATRISLAPHLPAGWNEVSLDHVGTGSGWIDFKLRRTAYGLALSANNQGPATVLSFSPEIPLGAEIVGAQMNNKPVAVKAENHAQDQHAALTVQLAHGQSEITIRYRGGVDVLVPTTTPELGEASTGMHLVETRWSGNQLRIVADHIAGQRTEIRLRTSRRAVGVEGASVEPQGTDELLLTFAPEKAGAARGAYVRSVALVHFAQELR